MGDLLQVLLDDRLHLALLLADLGALFLGEGGVLLLTERFSLLLQGEGVDTDRGTLDGETELTGLCFHIVGQLGALLDETFADLLAASLEFVGC